MKNQIKELVGQMSALAKHRILYSPKKSVIIEYNGVTDKLLHTNLTNSIVTVRARMNDRLMIPINEIKEIINDERRIKL